MISRDDALAFLRSDKPNRISGALYEMAFAERFPDVAAACGLNWWMMGGDASGHPDFIHLIPAPETGCESALKDRRAAAHSVWRGDGGYRIVVDGQEMTFDAARPFLYDIKRNPYKAAERERVDLALAWIEKHGGLLDLYKARHFAAYGMGMRKWCVDIDFLLRRGSRLIALDIKSNYPAKEGYLGINKPTVEKFNQIERAFGIETFVVMLLAKYKEPDDDRVKAQRWIVRRLPAEDDVQYVAAPDHKSMGGANRDDYEVAQLWPNTFTQVSNDNELWSVIDAEANDEPPFAREQEAVHER